MTEANDNRGVIVVRVHTESLNIAQILGPFVYGEEATDTALRQAVDAFGDVSSLPGFNAATTWVRVVFLRGTTWSVSAACNQRFLADVRRFAPSSVLEDILSVGPVPAGWR